MSTSLDKKRKLKGNNMIENNQLKSIIERLERLEEDRKAVVADIGEVYLEAKGNGFDTKIIKRIIAIRNKIRKRFKRRNRCWRFICPHLACLPTFRLGRQQLNENVPT